MDRPGRKQVLSNGITVERREIPKLFNDSYYSALAIYNRYKMFGLPFAGGWAEQPGYVIELIESFESISRDPPKRQEQAQVTPSKGRRRK